METMIQNYINGNLKDARRQAKQFSQTAIRCGFENYGYSIRKASRVAHWLKTGEGYQEACDTK
jgi:hypothetical protein